MEKIKSRSDREMDLYSIFVNRRITNLLKDRIANRHHIGGETVVAKMMAEKETGVICLLNLGKEDEKRLDLAAWRIAFLSLFDEIAAKDCERSLFASERCIAKRAKSAMTQAMYGG